ncbi:MAG: isochorismatase family protein [Candidatus Hydrogenedentes bacterium]|nr:isochorismatase family protein [Candidatus Hydrogenedentota bacterium]
MKSIRAACGISLLLCVAGAEEAKTITYENKLTSIANPRPILGDHPQWVQPVEEAARYEAPILVNDEGGNVEVRAWRFSYNARGIIEMPNKLRGDQTAIIVVHPWGVDDGQGWRTPEPAGVVDFCTPIKNDLSHKHIVDVLNPFLLAYRDKVAFVLYSQPGIEDPIRKKMYRSVRGTPTEAERKQGAQELHVKLNDFDYTGQPLPETIALGTESPVVDYFKQFPGIDASAHYNGEGFWDLPIPIVKGIDVDPDDVLIYDTEGYAVLKKFLKDNGVRHVLLTGYCTDMCYKSTCAGYENLSKDFNVFLVGDATLATFPSNSTPAYATNASLSYAALNQLVTQISWINCVENPKPRN